MKEPARSSGGGNLDIGCASRHPERVAGLVTIDSYHDDPKDLRAQGFRTRVRSCRQPAK